VGTLDGYEGRGKMVTRIFLTILAFGIMGCVSVDNRETSKKTYNSHNKSVGDDIKRWREEETAREYKEQQERKSFLEHLQRESAKIRQKDNEQKQEQDRLGGIVSSLVECSAYYSFSAYRSNIAADVKRYLLLSNSAKAFALEVAKNTYGSLASLAVSQFTVSSLRYMNYGISGEIRVYPPPTVSELHNKYYQECEDLLHDFQENKS
jgi:hypothetical protein